MEQENQSLQLNIPRSPNRINGQNNYKSPSKPNEDQFNFNKSNDKKLNVIRKKLKANIQQSTYASYGGLISPEGETRASSTHHFECNYSIFLFILIFQIYPDQNLYQYPLIHILYPIHQYAIAFIQNIFIQQREKKWNQSIIPLTCRMLNQSINNINLRLEVEGQPVEQAELVGHVCNISYGVVHTMNGSQNIVVLDISDLTDICQITIYQPQNDPENLIEYLKRTENWIYNPSDMLMGQYVKVLCNPKYAVTDQKWKNNCKAIKIISDANEITKHNLDVMKSYLDRKDGFIKKVRSPFENNPIYIRAKQREEEQKRKKIEMSELRDSMNRDIIQEQKLKQQQLQQQQEQQQEQQQQEQVIQEMRLQ